MSTPYGAPRMRASDQDRHEAVLALSEHFAQGRLDQAEFDVRMQAASEAVFLHDLDPLFVDLPRRAATVAPAPDPRERAASRRAWRHGPPFPVLPVLVALVVLLAVAVGPHALFLLVPAFWLAGAVARRRAWRHLAAAQARGSRTPGPPWR